MTDTTQKTVTGGWQKISDSDCTLQSVRAGKIYDVGIGTSAPLGDAALTLLLDEPTTFAYKSPVWVRLNSKGNAGMSSALNVIK